MRQDNTTPYGCLYQLDVNLTSPPLPATCTDNAGSVPITSHFTNGPFAIDDYIPPIAETCPTPNQFATNGILNGQGLPGGCTRDIFHRFYSEQYQFDGGKQDRYMTGSDASGLTMGHFNTKQLPIYTFLHSAGAPLYVVMDNFFQGAFGGSFLNHQWLVSAAAPAFANAAHDGGSTDLHSIVDTNGMPTATPLYAPTTAVKDSQLTVECTAPKGHHYSLNLACGDFAVNTTQPTYQPFSPGTAALQAAAAPHQRQYRRRDERGQRLLGVVLRRLVECRRRCRQAGLDQRHLQPITAAPIRTCWRAQCGRICPDGAFQFHHQPFNYYASYAPGTKARKEHLLDEAQFFEEANSGTLPKVSFIKPVGEENEHPGYASEAKGSNHLVNLLNAVFNGRDGKNTLVIVTYDEFGGQWDHVPPPGQAGGPSGPSDQWGPGTRIAAIAIAPKFRHSGVDHAEHDTTSLLATIEHQYGLAAMGTRDAAVSDLQSTVKIGLHGVKQ